MKEARLPGHSNMPKDPMKSVPFFVVFSLYLNGTQRGVNVLTKLDDPVRNKRISRRFIDTLYIQLNYNSHRANNGKWLASY